MSATMRAMVLTGHGDLERLVWREDWPRPVPGAGEVLIRVGACGLNNTDINTRTGWYAGEVTDGLSETAGAAGFAVVDASEATWGGRPLSFPRIQGADTVGVGEFFLARNHGVHEIKCRSAPPGRLFQGFQVRDVSLGQLDGFVHPPRPAAHLGKRPAHGAHGVARSQQLRYQPSADISGGPGHKDRFRIFHCFTSFFLFQADAPFAPGFGLMRMPRSTCAILAEIP